MDFKVDRVVPKPVDTDTEEGRKLRQEIRDFLKKNLTPEVLAEREAYYAGGLHTKEYRRKLAATGWTAPVASPRWPKEYGGVERSEVESQVIAEELGRSGVGGVGSGVGIVAPVIMRHGTEEQKREWFPRIARGEIEFSLGYSEPNAGTDLASLEMRAVPDGDDYIINGQKVYSTYAHSATHHWLAARTDPDVEQHRGISLFVVDLASPGITIRPLWTMADERTNEVFYDDVRVPRKNLIGEANQGWGILREALSYERTVVGSIVPGGAGGRRSILDELIEYAMETERNGRPLAKDPVVRQNLAQLAIDSSLRRLHGYRTAWMMSKGIVPEVEASMQKVWANELDQRMANTGLQILGLYGQLEPGSKWASLEGKIEHLYRFAVHLTYGGGSHELMRNIMATRGMGLPREPRL